MPIIKTTNHFLQRFERHIDDVLTWDEEISHSAEPTLFAAARHLCLAKLEKGHVPKAPSYFFAKGLGLFQSEVLDIAVTAEFIHNASLLHDDVDCGELRRGQPTVNVVWDSLTAVLAGVNILSEMFGF